MCCFQYPDPCGLCHNRLKQVGQSGTLHEGECSSIQEPCERKTQMHVLRWATPYGVLSVKTATTLQKKKQHLSTNSGPLFSPIHWSNVSHPTRRSRQWQGIGRTNPFRRVQPEGSRNQRVWKGCCTHELRHQGAGTLFRRAKALC